MGLTMIIILCLDGYNASGSEEEPDRGGTKKKNVKQQRKLCQGEGLQSSDSGPESLPEDEPSIHVPLYTPESHPNFMQSSLQPFIGNRSASDESVRKEE